MSSIDDLLKELKADSTGPTISKEEYEQAAREINAHMEQFAIEHRAYMQMSKEKARTAYVS